jgi:UDP-galactopyranose mutase
MAKHDVIVIGGGISGLSFAHRALRAGRQVLLVEGASRIGGCLHSERTPGGFWFELGAHTCYNSYGAFLELCEELGLLGELQPRGKPVLRFLDGDRVAPGKNLGALLRRMRIWQLVRSIWRVFTAKQDGQTVRSYYSRLVGPDNYARALGPMLSAVPSQCADDFPADMLFKQRPRRKDVIRSFTLPGGLATVAERIAAQAGLTLLVGRAAEQVTRSGDGFEVTLAGGGVETAPVLAMATPPAQAARLLRTAAPLVAAEAAAIGEAAVDSVGVVVRAERVGLPYSSFLIPLGDTFHSVVTRDVVPDPAFRAFTFHFQPGQSQGARLARVGAVLGLDAADLEVIAERRTVLPSPALGHRERVAEVDRLLAGDRLAITGNWFAGLSIEDCVLRSRAEWRRIAG